MNETADETTGGKLARTRKSSLTLIKVLVALVALGVTAAVFVPKIIRWQREAAVERAFEEILASPASAKELLATSPDLVNARDQWGYTPRHKAAERGHKGVAEVLLANGADVNAKGSGGKTSLHMAGRKDLAELLLANGAHVNAEDRGTWIPLHNSALEGRKDVAELLLANGADVKAKAQWGWTPLDRAKGDQNTELVELLKKHAAEE